MEPRLQTEQGATCLPLAYFPKKKGGTKMKRAWKWILPAALAALVIFVFSYGSLAAFTKSLSETSAVIRAKSFTFYVNESSSQKQSLGDAALAPGESKDYTVVLDGRSCETAVDATVTLKVGYDGAWPEGLSVRCGGEDVSDGCKKTFADLQSAGETKSVTYTVVWDDPHLDNYEPYRDFTLHLSVTVEAEQSR